MTRSSKTQGCFDASVYSLAGTEKFMSSIVLPFFSRKTCHSAVKSPWSLDLNSMCRRSASLQHLTNLTSKTQTAPQPLIGIWHLHTETLPGHIKTVDVWVCPDLDYPDIILISSWYYPDIILIPDLTSRRPRPVGSMLVAGTLWLKAIVSLAQWNTTATLVGFSRRKFPCTAWQSKVKPSTWKNLKKCLQSTSIKYNYTYIIYIIIYIYIQYSSIISMNIL